MMTWRFQLTRTEGEEELAVREVYLSDGKVVMWTENPIPLTGETAEEILKDLERIKADIEKYGILDIPIPHGPDSQQPTDGGVFNERKTRHE